jgi:hypothetical protein
MKAFYLGEALGGRLLNAIALQNAVLCADCDVVSDSPQERCMVCGSHSLVNLSRMLGGSLSKERATLITAERLAPERAECLNFPRAHAIRRRRSRKTA